MTLRLSGRCQSEGRKVRTRYLDITIVCASAILCYAAIAQGMQLVLELPEGVAVEIETCAVSEHASKGALCSSREGGHGPTSHFLRHGKRFMRHSYHARRSAPGPWGICIVSLRCCI
jgi:hypothetical protein